MAMHVSVMGGNGALELPAVTIDGYNAELRDKEGEFLGDRASDGAFEEILEEWRERMRKADGEDPLGDEPTSEFGKKKLDKTLKSGSPEAIGLLQAAVEDFAQEVAKVVKRFLRLKEWRGVERIVIGGGLAGSRIGEHVIGRTAVILKADKVDVDIRRIRYEADKAALIGAAHLVPAWTLDGFDAYLAVDIGGSKMRTGIVELRLDKEADLSAAAVAERDVWKHRDAKASRREAVERLTDMLSGHVKAARREKLRLAPIIGIGCPGRIDPKGFIRQGAQNLPGNWESERFNLPEALRQAIPEIAQHPTTVIMHNDAVVQGLAEVPFMRDVRRWGIFTIGTGLGNACFTTVEPAD
jgi:predicted NBD/HSP70 family sugar kinase